MVVLDEEMDALVVDTEMVVLVIVQEDGDTLVIDQEGVLRWLHLCKVCCTARQ